ncbi:MAG: hypothetical protein ACR652_07630 [Methylocystis sp.]|uniref:hypothetical protein n=1 Tax=Methylocystis sp. TaxID=1911079 RepID=UPI003DA569AF
MIRMLKDFRHYRAGQTLELPAHEADALIFFGVASDAPAEAAERIQGPSPDFSAGSGNASARELLQRRIDALDLAASAKAGEVKQATSEEEIAEIERAHGSICDELAAHNRALRVLESIS